MLYLPFIRGLYAAVGIPIHRYRLHDGNTQLIAQFEPHDLPESARQYLTRLSEVAGCPIALVSTGPDRNQTILLKDPFS